MITDGEIDFATYAHFTLSTTDALTAHFEENMEAARKALQSTDDKALEKPFSLKREGQILYTTPKIKDIPTTLNHWVHHRGQLTVYMRMNDIPVPSIYGPSADDNTFKAPGS
jgi:uncharacterized damage-inducible protein DinB